MPYTGSAFVGRERELSAIEELLDRAAKREAVVLDLVGEPGIGKTRLLREAIERGRTHGFTAHSGHGSELERELPFGLLVDTFERPLAWVGCDDLDTLAREHRERLARLCSAFSTAPAVDSETAHDERHAIARAMAHLVTTLTERGPLMLVVDDVHWADAASVGVLAHLVDRICDLPLVIAFASRHGQRPPALEAAIERAERDGRVARVELSPLSPEHVDGLLGERLAEPLRAELLRESGGNPFYAEQLARMAQSNGRFRPGDPMLAGVPPPVARALAVELANLRPKTRTVAHALAVAGDHADPELVADVALVEPSAVARSLDELIDTDLVRAAADSPTFAFRHPIVRRAIYGSAPPAWRIDAHRRAAAALRERGAPVARRAHHEEYAARPGDREAIGLLAQAASEHLTVAPATAVRYYRAALRLMPDAEARGDAGLALRLPLALALATAGAMDDSRDALRDVLAALPERDEPRRAAVVTAMAAIDHLLGRYEEGRALLVCELALLGDDRVGARGRICQSLATNHYFAGEWPPMRDAALEAFDRARDAEAPVGQAEAAATASVACGALGDRGEAERLTVAAREALEQVADAGLVAHLSAAFWVGLAELHLEHYGHARRVLERGLALSRRTGQESAAVQLCVGLASVCTLTGRLAEARRASAFAVDVARLNGVPNLLGWAEIARCWVALQEGRLEEALEAGAYVECTVAELGTPAFSGGICALAEARVIAGDAREGRDGLLAAAGGEDLARLTPLLCTWAYYVLTQADLKLGDSAAAATWAGRATRSAAVLGLDRDLAFARLAEARVALAGDDIEHAAEAALLSADAADRCGAVPQAVRARMLAGVATARAGNDEHAAKLLEAAHRDARSCGALGDRNDAARALREIGRRPGGHSAGTTGSHLLAALSERERDVAELLAARLRNRQIAERLHLSEKTVERHVSRILGKLGVDSRVDVARAVDRERASR